MIKLLVLFLYAQLNSNDILGKNPSILNSSSDYTQVVEELTDEPKEKDA